MDVPSTLRLSLQNRLVPGFWEYIIFIHREELLCFFPRIPQDHWVDEFSVIFKQNLCGKSPPGWILKLSRQKCGISSVWVWRDLGQSGRLVQAVYVYIYIYIDVICSKGWFGSWKCQPSPCACNMKNDMKHPILRKAWKWSNSHNMIYWWCRIYAYFICFFLFCLNPVLT